MTGPWLKIAYKRDGEISAGKVKCKSHDEIMNSVRMKLKCLEYQYTYEQIESDKLTCLCVMHRQKMENYER